MRGREHDHRHRRIARFFLGDRDGDGGMRIDEMSGLAQGRAHGGSDFVFTGTAGGETCTDFRKSRTRDLEALGLREITHQRRHWRGVATIGLEQEPLEIRRHLDVHRGELVATTSRGS